MYKNYFDLIQPPLPTPTPPSPTDAFFFTTSLLPTFLSFLHGPLCLIRVVFMSSDVGLLSVWATYEWLHHWGNYSPPPSNPLTTNSHSSGWVSLHISISPIKMNIKGGIAEGDKEFFALWGFLQVFCLFSCLFYKNKTLILRGRGPDLLW